MGKIAAEAKEFIRTLSRQVGISPKKFVLYLFLLGITILILIPILTFAWYFRDLTSKENILTRKNAGIVLLDRDDKPFFSFYDARRKSFVPISDIPEKTQHAFVAVEDKDFYTHPGFSLSGYGRAFVQILTQREIVSGGSTISQQLVKTNLLTSKQTFLRKYQELVLALEIDRRYQKDEILEMYLNSVYFGEGAFGIADAAKTYFNKEPKDLTIAESAMLAGILPAPSAYSPISGDEEKARIRQELVLGLMREQNYITTQEETQALTQKLRYATPEQSDINDVAPHFALMVKDELIEKYGEQDIAGSGFTVKTTLNRDWQEYAETTVKNQVANLNRNNATNGAAVVIDPKTGEILTLVGSHDWFDEDNGKINMALSPRQPGSSFKPLMYAAAFDAHAITTGTLLDDKPITFPGGYKPKNYDGKFRGPVLPRRALASSLNIPALLVMDRVGVSEGVEFAKDLGITTLDENHDYGLPLVLGAAEVPLLEMTSAYAVMAAEGEKIKPTTILEIMDKKGKKIYEYKPEGDRVLDNAVAYIISSILSDNKARAEVFGGSLTVSRPAAVKTGTTEDYRDALTIGYTPNIVIGVWVGNNDRTPMDRVAGSLGAAPIWRSLMNRYLSELPKVEFRKPLGVREIPICLDSGLRSYNTASDSANLEIFLSGTEPKQYCDQPSPTPSESPTPTPENEDNNNDNDDKDKDKDKEKNTPTATPLPTVPLASPTNTQTPTPTNTLGL